MVPLNPILEVEIFDVWGIDFMGPFPKTNDNKVVKPNVNALVHLGLVH